MTLDYPQPEDLVDGDPIGLGRVRRIECVEATKLFSAQPSLDDGMPHVVSRHLLGHGTCVREILRAKEALTDWEPDGNWTSND